MAARTCSSGLSSALAATEPERRVLNIRALPINAMIDIPGSDPDAKRFVEWHGFSPTHITPQSVTMRRQSACGSVPTRRKSGSTIFSFGRQGLL